MRKLALAAALLALSGCAVMKVDVDVYKGPIANHDDVQAQQIAVLAVAAKPLLVKLRDTIQWPNSEYGDEKEYYKADYIEDHRIKWRSEYAKQVNAILSLYKDKGPGELELFLGRARGLMEGYKKQVSILRGVDEGSPADAYSWAKISPGLKQPPTVGLAPIEAELHANQTQREPACTTFYGAPLDYLSQAYRLLLDPKFFAQLSSSRDIFNSYALRQAMYCINKRGAAMLAIPDAELVPEHGDLSSNAMFEYLAKPANIELHARLLFKDPNSLEARAFTQRVTEVARAFLESRRILHDVLADSLGMLTRLASPPMYDFDAGHPEVRLALAHMISELQQPTHLVVATCFPFAHMPQRAELRGALRARGIGTIKTWEDEDRSRANLQLRDLLVADPVGMPRLLLAADRALAEAPQGTPPACGDGIVDPLDKADHPNPLNQWRGGREFRYGIARGPTISGDPRRFVQSIESAFDQISNAGGLGLEHGRIPTGLETLIDRYLVDFPKCREARRRGADTLNPIVAAVPAGCEGFADLRENLGNSLIHFAVKVSYLANNDVLLSKRPSSPLPLLDLLPSEHNGGDPDRRREFTLVLQAVGSAILTHVDELRFRREHQGRLGLIKDAELETLQKALELAPEMVIGEIASALRASTAVQDKLVEEQEALIKTAAVPDKTKESADAKTAADKAAEEKKTTATALGTAKKEAEGLVAAHATLTGADAEARTDAQALRKAVVDDRAGNNADGPTVADEMAAWLDGQVKSYDSKYDKQPRPLRLGLARDYLKARRASVGPASAVARDKAFDAIVANLALNKTAAETAIAAAQKDDSEKDTALKAAQAKSKTAAETLTTAQDQAAKAAKARDAYKDAKTEFDDAAAVLQECGGVLLKASGTPPEANPAKLIDAMRAALKDKNRAKSFACASVPGRPLATRLDNAGKALERRLPPVPWARVSTNLPEPSDARDVLDRLISALQYQRIQAAVQDPSGARPAQIERALSVAEEYRSDMIYLRPAGAYLRNSYPASALQADPGLGWSNLLDEHAVRSLPIFGSKLVNARSAEDVRIQSQIDKQFWQNVNSVRVAGAGNTNYAIAKDDIGNWYVKAYSADPREIIKAAQSMALFNMGTAGGDLLGRLRKERAAQAQAGGQPVEPGAAPVPPARQTTSLERLHKSYEDKYVAKTKKDHERVGKDLAPDKVAGAVKDAWAADKDLESYKSVLEDTLLKEAQAQLTKDWPVFADAKKTEEQASQVIEALNALVRFRNALARGIADKLPAETKDTPPKKPAAAALAAVDRVIGPKVKKELAEREAAVKDYATAVTFIGEAASAENAEPAKN